jgi:hypothetical protein
MKVHFHLIKGSLSLIDHKFQSSIANAAITDVVCDVQLLQGSFKVFLNFTLTFKCLASIGTFDLYDTTNKNGTFNRIISRRQTQSSGSSLMTLFVEKSPSGSKSDFYFGVNLDRVDIILNSKFIQKLSIHNFHFNI